MGRKLLPDIFDEVNEVFGVAICHVYADVLELRHGLNDGRDLLKVSVAGSRADGNTLGTKHIEKSIKEETLKGQNSILRM